MPFYPSPLKDDGYDIADYTDVHPDVRRRLRDFKVFLREAHTRACGSSPSWCSTTRRTSIPGFSARAARSRAAAGAISTSGATRPIRYRDARIIFKDFETINWSWDPVAKAYFWHRFYSHQPDLNFDNPHVKQPTVRRVDHWFKMGVDGLRLDAVPYLYEREGTNCENLPETHAFLKELRRHIDERFQNRMLLAEANQWPEDAAGLFRKRATNATWPFIFR